MYIFISILLLTTYMNSKSKSHFSFSNLVPSLPAATVRELNNSMRMSIPIRLEVYKCLLFKLALPQLFLIQRLDLRWKWWMEHDTEDWRYWCHRGADKFDFRVTSISGWDWSVASSLLHVVTDYIWRCGLTMWPRF